MSDHKQEEISVQHPYYGTISFYVDEKIKDIIINCFYWNFPTVLSCQDNNGNIWLAFELFNNVKELMQLTLAHRMSINGQGFVQETLFDYIEQNVNFDISFTDQSISDPNNKDTVISTGVIDYIISMRFPSSDLKHFQKLFFEVFPPKE